MLAKQNRWAKRSASYCSIRGTSSECLLLVGGFSAGCSDLRLLSGDASSVCNFNIGFAARPVVVCYLLCSAEFAIRQRHYSASLQLALSLCDKRLCAIFFSGGNYKFPFLFSAELQIRQNIRHFYKVEFLRPFGSK